MSKASGPPRRQSAYAERSMDTVERTAALSPSEKFHELFDGEPCIGDDSAQRARSDLVVIGNDDPGVRLVAAEDHMAAGLATEDEPSALKGCADFKAR
jgi:hypothetical protein